MLYYLFNYLKQHFDLVGTGVFQYISFRVAMAVVVSLVITLVFGKRLINILRRHQIGETVRDLGLKGESSKKGTPTMGGIIILAAIIIPTLLFAKLTNVYVILILISTLWLGTIGFIDDYIKVFKKNKEGLSGKFKVIGQIGLGLIVGSVLYFNNNVVIHRKIVDNDKGKSKVEQVMKNNKAEDDIDSLKKKYVDVNTPITTIPFVKKHEFNYARLISWISPNAHKLTWLLYIIIVIFIITAVSNGANMTDGLDGLATGVSAIIGIGIGIFAYLSGNIKFAGYLNIMYIPHIGELSIFIAAFIGACIGFLWYNAFPAQVFMGDTGSLAIGGIIAALAIMVRKELLIPIFCGVFLVENISVMLQVGYFKYTKSRYGEGKRVFLMAPLHHHYQKLGYHESKIAVRFWIITILCVVVSILTLKLR